MTIDSRQFATGGDPATITFGAQNSIASTFTNCFVFGYGNNAGGDQNFVAGVGNHVGNVQAGWLPKNVFIHGEDNDRGVGNQNHGINSFTQGRSNFMGSGNVEAAAHRNIFCQGEDNGWATAGTNNENLNIRWDSVFVQGRSNRTRLASAYELQSIFVQGRYNTFGGATRTRCSFVHGENNLIASGNNYTFVSGLNFSTAPGSTSFSQGYGYAGSGALGYASFSQGAAVTVAGDYSFGQGGWYIDINSNTSFGFAQGAQIYLTSAIAGSYAIFGQGRNITTTVGGSGHMLQGRDITFDYNGSANVAYGVFIQGRNVSARGALVSDGRGVFVQGDGVNMSIGGTNTGLAEGSFVQGWSINASGATNNLGAALIQGSTITITGSTQVDALFLQGRSLTITQADNMFVQGTSHTVTAARTFAQGASCKVTRDDQKTWGSNRTGVVSGAQSSKIIKHVQTTDALVTTLLTFDLEEDKAYSINIRVVAFNTTTDSEWARFDGSFLAGRATAGAANLTGGTQQLSRVVEGAGPINTYAEISASGNDILLRVRGETAQTYEWCVDFEFVEVAG